MARKRATLLFIVECGDSHQPRHRLFHYDGVGDPALVRELGGLTALACHDGEMFFGNREGTFRLHDYTRLADTSCYVYDLETFRGRLLASEAEKVRDVLTNRVVMNVGSEERWRSLIHCVDAMAEHDGVLYVGGYSGHETSGVFAVNKRFKLGKAAPVARFRSSVKDIVSLDGELYVVHGMLSGAFPDLGGHCHITALGSRRTCSVPEEIRRGVGANGRLYLSGTFLGLIELNPRTGRCERILRRYGMIHTLAVAPEHVDIQRYRPPSEVVKAAATSSQ